MKFEDLDLKKIGNTIQMIGGIWEGEGKTFLFFFPGDAPDRMNMLETMEMTLEEWVAFMRQSDIMETEILQKDTDGKIVKAIVRKSQRVIDGSVSWAVYKRDGYRCRYCGKEVPLTVDHLVAWEVGGPSTPENLVACCKKCNKRKGNMSYREWLEDPYYKKVSEALTVAQRQRNEVLVYDLDRIPRLIHPHSR